MSETNLLNINNLQINLVQQPTKVKTISANENKKLTSNTNQHISDSITASNNIKLKDTSTTKIDTSLMFCSKPDSNYVLYEYQNGNEYFLQTLFSLNDKNKEQKFIRKVTVKEQKATPKHLINRVIYQPRKQFDAEMPNILQRIVYPTDWIFTIVMISLSLFGWIKMKFHKLLNQTIKAVFNHQISSRLYREQNSLTQRISLLLFTVYLINMSIFISQALQYHNLIIYNFNSIVGNLLIFIVLILIYGFKLLMYNFIGYLFKAEKLIDDYVFNQLNYYRTLGLLLFLVVISLPFVSDYLRNYLFITGIALFAIFYFARIIRGMKIMLEKNTSVVYLILYLCTLEILPILVLYRFMLSLIM